MSRFDVMHGWQSLDCLPCAISKRKVKDDQGKSGPIRSIRNCSDCIRYRDCVLMTMGDKSVCAICHVGIEYDPDIGKWFSSKGAWSFDPNGNFHYHKPKADIPESVDQFLDDPNAGTHRERPNRMDPNATLDRIRELRETQTQFKEDRWDQMVEALDLVGQLDNWLTAKSKGGKGGCLPNDWDVS